MDDFTIRLLHDALREAESLVSPLLRACRSHIHLYHFFLEIGWDLQTALGTDLAAVRSHVETARFNLEGLPAALARGDESAVALAARDMLRDVIQSAQPLFDLLQAARPLPVSEEVLAAFAEDLADHLLTLYVANKTPLLFRLGLIFGLLRPERATPLHAAPPDGRMLRYPVMRMLIRPRQLVMGALNPALGMLAGLNDPETFPAVLRARLEAAAARVLEATRGRGLQGLQLRLAPTGLYFDGGPLPRPPDGAAVIRVPLHPSGTPVLEVGPSGWGLTWAAMSAVDGELTLFEVAGVRLFIPARPGDGGPLTGVTLGEAAGAIRMDLVGALGIHLPAHVVAGAEGDVKASAAVRVSWQQGQAPSASLDGIQIKGRFHIGGADGLLIDEAELTIGAVTLPPPLPTAERPLPFDLGIKGKLVLLGGDLEIMVEAEHVQGTWTVRSSGQACFPNGVELHPVEDKPVLELTARPGAGKYGFAVAGALEFPQAGAVGTGVLVVRGALQVAVADRLLSLESFEAGVQVDNWALSSDLEIEHLGLTLRYSGDRFATLFTATIPLGGGFELAFLDSAPADLSGPAPATGLTVSRSGGATTFLIQAGVRVTVPTDVLTGGEDDEPVELEAFGSLTLSTSPAAKPSLQVASLALRTKRLHLGGADGLVIEEAAVEARNLDRLFGPRTEPCFELVLGGRLVCPLQETGGQLALELKGAVFSFPGLDEPPTFDFEEPGELGFAADGLGGLPLQITGASIKLRHKKPLPEVLAPNNVLIRLSAKLSVPLDGDGAALTSVDDLTIAIDDHGIPRIAIGGLTIGVSDLTLGTMVFSGAMTLRNLRDPSHLIIAGELGGTYNGAGITALVALRMEGGVPTPLGVCLNVSGGQSGITLPYGFMILGASGGISYANTNRDPCEFATYIDTNRPLPTRLPIYSDGVTPSSRPTSGAGCPGGCPPPSMNILCQPHPDQQRYPGRAILKFSALDDDFVGLIKVPVDGSMVPLPEALGVFDAALDAAIAESAGPERIAQISGDIATMVVDGLATAVASLLPPQPAPENLVPPPPKNLGEVFKNPVRFWRDKVGPLLVEAVERVIGDALAGAPARPKVRQIVHDALYQGLPCPDETLQVTGTFSYAGVSTFASVTGGVNVSTTGSIGVLGSLNIFGIPVGQLRAFVTATGATGDLDPSLCGDLRFEVGPLYLGQMSLLYNCPGCITNIAGAVARFGDKLGGTLIRRAVEAVAASVAKDPRFAPERDPGGSLRLLAPAQATGFVTHLLSRPLDGEDAVRLQGFTVELMRDVWAAFQPQFVLDGRVAPRLFGFPLLAKDGVVDARALIKKDYIEAQFTFQPLYLMIAAMGGAYAIAGLFAANVDHAEMGLRLELPTLEQIILDGLSGRYRSEREFAAYIDDGVERFLRSVAFTFSYELSPCGLTLAEAGGRALMPAFTPHHPSSAHSVWKNPDADEHLPPEQRRATRVEVLAAALESGKLTDIFWSGALQELFPERPAMKDELLQRDYFPHGGILGASRVVVPRALLDAPPWDLLDTIAGGADPFARIKALISYVKDYCLATEEVGTLAFYVPAPNPPPGLRDTPGVGARRLIESIRSADMGRLIAKGLSEAGDLYAFDLAFLRGRFDGRLLGVPIGSAVIEAVPAPRSGGAGHFLIRAQVIENTWLRSFVTGASLEFRLSQAPPTSILRHFSEILPRLEAARDDPDAALADICTAAWSGMLGSLPRLALEAVLDDFHVPTALAGVLGVRTGLTARLFAFSPYYEPTYQGTGLYADVRRTGGILFQLQPLTFRVGLTDVSVELAELVVRPAGGAGALAMLPAISASFEAQRIELVGLELAPRIAGQTLCARLDASPSSANGFDVRFELGPARLSLSVFGSGTEAILHGAREDQPFVLSTFGEWSAGVSISGLTLRAPNGPALLRVGAPRQAVTATLTGHGDTWKSLTVQIPVGIEVVALPDEPPPIRRQIVRAGGALLSVTVTNGEGITISGTGLTLQIPGLFDAEIAAELGLSCDRGVPEVSCRFSGVAAASRLPGAPVLAGIAGRYRRSPLGESVEGEATLTSAIDLGVLRIVPLGPAGLAVRFSQVMALDKPVALSLECAPARIEIDGLSTRIAIHGQHGANDPFQFDTRGPWSCRVEVLQRSFKLVLDGKTLLAVETSPRGTSQIQASVTGQGLSALAVQLVLSGDIKVRVLPEVTSYALPVLRSGGRSSLTFAARKDELAVEVKLSPLEFGVFHVRGSDEGRTLKASLDREGVRVGAATLGLEIPGLTSPTLTLDELRISTKGEFQAGVSLGAFRVEKLLELTPSSLRLECRSGDYPRLKIGVPDIRLFPGTSWARTCRLSSAERFMEQSGDLVVSTGEEEFALPGLLSARGTFLAGRLKGAWIVSLHGAQLSFPALPGLQPRCDLSIGADGLSGSFRDATLALGLLAVSAGSWQIDHEREKKLRLAIQSPAVTLLGCSIAPSAALELYVDSHSNVSATFSVTAIPVIVGLVELSAAVVQYTREGTTARLHVGATASLFQTGRGWLVSTAVDFEQQAGSSVTLTVETKTLLETPIMAIDASAGVELERTGEAFALVVQGFKARLLGTSYSFGRVRIPDGKFDLTIPGGTTFVIPADQALLTPEVSLRVLKDSALSCDPKRGELAVLLSVALSFRRTLSLGALGDISVNVQASGQVSLAHRDGGSAAVFSDGRVSFDRGECVFPRIALPSQNNVSGLVEAIWKEPARILKDASKLPLIWLEWVKSGFVKGVVDDAKSIAALLRDSFQCPAEDVAALLHKSRYAASQIGEALHGAFGYSTSMATLALQDVGCTLDQVDDYLHQGAHAGKDVAAAILKDAGYAGKKIVDKLGCSEQEFVDVLQRAKYTAEEVGAILKHELQQGDDAITRLLGGAGYAMDEVKDVLKRFSNLAEEKVDDLVDGFKSIFKR